MLQTKAFIDLHKLMQQTNFGRDIYEMILPDLQREDSEHYKKALNPFYGDTNPALSVYKGDKGYWRHLDFGDPTFTGDSIDMAAHHYDLDRQNQFGKLLHQIAADLKLDLKLIVKESDCSPFISEWWKDEEGLEMAHSYFANYGITKDILKRYSVRAVRKYPVINKNGNLDWRYFPKDKITIAYEDINHTKLYTPGEDKRFEFIGRKPKDFIFGKGQILTDIRRTKNYDRGPLIITGGEKDVLTLTALGYDAITFNSETASLPKHLEGFLAIYNIIVVLYDIDETGKREAAKLAETHKLPVCNLPDELLEKGGKDVSDYVKLGLSIADLRKLIENSVTPVILPTPTKEGQGNESTTTTPSEISGTLFLPDELYTLLPDTLKDICAKFEDRREKDVCLLSCITILSTCFPAVQGIYDNRRIGCNFNLFITAPASAGKGIMSWSRILGNNIDRYLRWQYKMACTRYEAALATYIQGGKTGEKPEPPKEPMFFIPANSSTSSIYECLDGNQKFGIIFDNEGDTLSSIMKNDWADFSSLIRKGFHHENVEMKRRTNNEYRRIERPHLSLLLSGTRNQVTKLIDSVENGLFSRFGFYDFNLDLQWKDKFGSKESGLEEFFESHGSRLLDYWKQCEKTDEILCLIDDSDREFIFDYFKKKLSSLYSLHGEDIIANVRRTCIIYYRIAMILTALWFFEQPNSNESSIPQQMILDKEQSFCAFLIVDTLLKHLEFVFTRIQMTGAVSKLNFKQRSLYNALPKEFTWQEFLSIADENGIGNAATQKYRRDFINAKLIVSPEHGKFRKI